MKQNVKHLPRRLTVSLALNPLRLKRCNVRVTLSSGLGISSVASSKND